MANGDGDPDSVGYTDITSGTDDQELKYEDFLSGLFGQSQIVGQQPKAVLSSGSYFPGMPAGIRGIMSPLQEDGPRIPHSINQAVALVHDLPEDQMLNWKQALYDAGLYAPDFYSRNLKPRQIGIMDENDTGAMTQLAALSARAKPGTTLQDVLALMKKDNPFSKDNGFGKEPKHITAQVHDPASIRQYARTAAQELLGRDLDDKTLNALTQKMMAQETGAVTGQAQAQMASSESTGSTIDISQDFDVAARTAEAVEAANASEAEAKRFASGYDVFMKMVTGG